MQKPVPAILELSLNLCSTSRGVLCQMAIELPYLPTYKNVPLLFENIAKAKVPDAFTNSFLSGTLGLKSTNDRALITLLKKLGFLDNSGKPTPAYAS